MSDHATRTHPPHGDPTPNAPANAPQTLSEDGTRQTLVAPDGLPGLSGVVSPPGYTLLAEVGRGGMGLVYRAHDTALNRDVAVKILHDRYPPSGPAARRFLEEAGITSQLQHPGIAPVHQVGALPDGRPYLVMKLIKGETLDRRLAGRQNPSDERGRFLAVFEQVCLAVGYAHSSGVVHRDLKPHNVMVGKFGEVQVMDWGLAKVLGAPGARASDAEPELPVGTAIRSVREAGSETVTGAVLGTPAYMPPEQAGGEVDRIGPRSDVFALGGILCVILTGKPPYTGRNTNELQLKAIRGQTAEALARLDSCGAEPELVTLARRCLGTDPADRPADAGEVGRVVAGFRADAEARARQAELDRVRAEGDLRAAELKAAEQRKRRMVQLALSAAVALLVFAAGAFAWWRDKQATAARAEEERRRTQTEVEATAALTEMATLCDRGEKEIDNPPRWRLTLAAARSAQRRAAVALDAGPASDELRERFHAATARLDRDEFDCETAGLCEKWFVDLISGVGRSSRQPGLAALHRGVEGLLGRIGVTPATATPQALAAAVRGHRLRYQLTVVVLLSQQVLKPYPLAPHARELARDAHPLQPVFRQAAANKTIRTVLADGPGRPLTSTELVCLYFGFSLHKDNSAIESAEAEQLLHEARSRNPADLLALVLRGGHNSRTKIYDVVGPNLPDVLFVMPLRRNPRILTEEDTRQIAAAESAVVLRPDLSVFWRRSADELSEGGFHAWAVERVRRAIELDPDVEDHYVRLATSLRDSGQMGEALATYRVMLRRFPSTSWITANAFVDVMAIDLRLDAARCAILLAHDAGDETKRLTDAQKRELRREALRWMRDWLTEPVVTRLDLFLVKRDPAYRFVRDAEFLDQFPPDERDRWHHLWAEIRSTHGFGNERFALVGDKVEPVWPSPPAIAPPPREVKRS